MQFADATELLRDYDQWTAEKANRDDDYSPQAFLLERQQVRATRAIDAAVEEAESAWPALQEALDAGSVPAPLIPAIEQAIRVCTRVGEAARWE